MQSTLSHRTPKKSIRPYRASVSLVMQMRHACAFIMRMCRERVNTSCISWISRISHHKNTQLRTFDAFLCLHYVWFSARCEKYQNLGHHLKTYSYYVESDRWELCQFRKKSKLPCVWKLLRIGIWQKISLLIWWLQFKFHTGKPILCVTERWLRSRTV